jgi:hypothetical protein
MPASEVPMSANRDNPFKGHWLNVRQIVGIVTIMLLLFTYYAYTWRNGYNFRTALGECSKPFCDFAEYYYPMGASVFHTALPVKGFVYSPFIAILFALFAPLGSDTALLFWRIVQGVSILLYLVLFLRIIPSEKWIQLLFVFIALSSLPLLQNLAWGQVGIVTTVSILGALFSYERGQRAIAAVLLAFGISFKFFPLIFLLPFVIRRDVRFLLYSFVACGVFLILVPASLLGVDGATRFYSALLDSYRHFDWVISNYNSQHFPHALGRLAKGMGFNAYAYLPFLRWIGYGIAAINMGFLYLIQRARLPHAHLWSFHILFLTIPFVLLTSWPSDLVYISFAQGLLAWQLLEEKNIHKIRYTTLILLLASIVLSNIIFFKYIGNSHEYGFYGAIFWSDLLLLAASYMELLPSVLRQIRRVSVSDPPLATASPETSVFG